MPLRDFLDLEEMALVERDRKLAWEIWLGKHPSLLENLDDDVEPGAAP